jgi:hypothetical protein
MCLPSQTTSGADSSRGFVGPSDEAFFDGPALTDLGIDIGVIASVPSQ